MEDDEGDVGLYEGMLEILPSGKRGPIGQKHDEVQGVQGGRQAVLEEKEGGRHRVGLDGPQKNDDQVLDKDVEKRIAGETMGESVGVKGGFFGKTEGHFADFATISAARLNPEEYTLGVNVPRGAGAGTGAQQGAGLLFFKADSARFHFVDWIVWGEVTVTTAPLLSIFLGSLQSLRQPNAKSCR